jgi:hypothetical protein
MISLMIVAVGIAVFGLAVRYLKVFPEEEELAAATG